MKQPKDVPTKAGDLVKQRGTERTGVAVQYLDSCNWFRIKWDDSKGPLICHQNELQLVHGAPVSALIASTSRPTESGELELPKVSTASHYS